MEGDSGPREANIQWRVTLLGAFDVTSDLGVRPAFRSRSVKSLLALLCLSRNGQLSRFSIQETLWPESTGDCQSQNLRRVVSDLRKALGTGEGAGPIVETLRETVTLDLTGISCDAREFWRLTEAMVLDQSLAEALQLYQGPLLPDTPEAWAYPYQLEYEERFVQALESFAESGVRRGMAKEVIRCARSALRAAPHREEVHVSLILAYRAAGLEAEALRQFEDLERHLEENWGERPSQRALQAISGDAPVLAVAPVPTERVDPVPTTPIELSGGAVPLDSPYYVRRPVDADAERAVGSGESVVLVHGPRQVGKSSLLARLLQDSRQRKANVAFTDFQAIGTSQLEEEEKLYRTLIHSLASQLQAAFISRADWNDWIGPNLNFDAALSKILADSPGSVVWGIDEVDRVFGRRYSDDFFGLLRSWHNRRALEPGGPWQKLTLVLSYATEAHLFISDLNQSPFNVGVRLSLCDFDLGTVEELAQRHGLSAATAAEVHHLTHGQPFMTRRALAFLAQGGTLAWLNEAGHLEDGPFAEHLHRLLVSVSQDDAIASEVRRLVRGEPLQHSDSARRLWSAGLLDGATPMANPRFRVPLYHKFLAGFMG